MNVSHRLEALFTTLSQHGHTPLEDDEGTFSAINEIVSTSPDALRPFLDEAIRAVIAAIKRFPALLHHNHNQASAKYALAGFIAEMVGANFGQHLAAIVLPLIGSIRSLPFVDNEPADMAIVTALTTASATLVTMFAATKVAFSPFFYQVQDTLADAAHLPQGAYACPAITALISFFDILTAMEEPESACICIESVLPPIIKCWRQQMNKDVVVRVCNELAPAIQGMAKVSLERMKQHMFPGMWNCILLVLKCQLPCQNPFDQVLNAELLSATLMIASSMALTLPTTFVREFKKDVACWVPYLDGTKVTSYARILDLIAEVIGWVKEKIAPLTMFLWEYAMRAIAFNMKEVQAAGIGIIGLLVEHAIPEVEVSFVTQAFNAFEGFLVANPRADLHESIIQRQSNAVGAFSRICLKYPNFRPPAKAVSRLLSGLPLDPSCYENSTVSKALVVLYNRGRQDASLQVDLTAINTALEEMLEKAPLASHVRADVACLVAHHRSQPL